MGALPHSQPMMVRRERSGRRRKGGRAHGPHVFGDFTEPEVARCSPISLPPPSGGSTRGPDSLRENAWPWPGLWRTVARLPRSYPKLVGMVGVMEREGRFREAARVLSGGPRGGAGVDGRSDHDAYDGAPRRRGFLWPSIVYGSSRAPCRAPYRDPGRGVGAERLSAFGASARVGSGGCSLT